MKELPKISIITPSFNQGEFIEKTIQSVINQDYSNTEYIVIDGGSSDSTVEIIEQYEKHITYWISEPDTGQSNAINKGLKKATGEIWAYLCSDDTYNEGVLQSVATVFQENPNCDLIYGGCNFINENNIVTRVKRPGEFNRKKLLMGNYLYQPSVFLRTNIFQRFGLFSEELNYSMDYEYWLRISKEANFCYIDKILSNYRLHTNSKSMDQIVSMVRESSKVRKRYGAGWRADLDYILFVMWGQHYYRFKRRFFEWISA
ncbi:MAG: glycosyltransferase [Candidatus Marinimicrobia bacterium]|nr:glycosyltransferase [Candidatus Neomarinimicrobiota bacterium]MCF7828784.1 glycosyltransferase [Candidatus Neomarinimicrobiota bacterium]MCF7880701.1 glycosyltransferase [Candidatus Neomarinimicrobiota bacterium]